MTSVRQRLLVISVFVMRSYVLNCAIRSDISVKRDRREAMSVSYFRKAQPAAGTYMEKQISSVVLVCALLPPHTHTHTHTHTPSREFVTKIAFAKVIGEINNRHRHMIVAFFSRVCEFALFSPKISRPLSSISFPFFRRRSRALIFRLK
jgi:hypothetical protein